ncbi:MAG: hypothetical protein ABI999_11480 [Acidobacteriota bacterium]
MKILFFVLSFFIAASPTALPAQAWQLSVVIGGNVTIHKVNSPQDPLNGMMVSDRHMAISVSDQNGRPVEGLKAGNFKAIAEACTPDVFRPCEYRPVATYTFKGDFQLFREYDPGLYFVDFRTTDMPPDWTFKRAIFIRVFRTLTPAEVIAVRHGLTISQTQKAQILLD